MRGLFCILGQFPITSSRGRGGGTGGYLKGRFNAGFFALQVLGLIFGNLWYAGHFFILL